MLTTLRTAEEVRGIDEIGRPDLPKPDPQMLQIAEKIVEQQSGEFDPSEFVDRYEDALRALIEEKRRASRSSRGQAGQRRHQGRRPHGGAEEEPGRRCRTAAGRRQQAGGGRQEEAERPEGGVMGTQLPLPAQWAFARQSRRDPRDRLAALRRDATETKAAIREALDALASRHDIAPKDIEYAMASADDMLADAIYTVERELEREIEGEEPV